MTRKTISLLLTSIGICTLSIFTEPARAISCNDFYFQESAQDFLFDYQNFYDELDPDGDGWACEHLARRYSDLTKDVWNELLYYNRQRKLQSNNKRSLTYAEVNQIIGFYPDDELTNGRYVWSDSIDSQRIEIRFRNGQVAQMKGIGF